MQPPCNTPSASSPSLRKNPNDFFCEHGRSKRCVGNFPERSAQFESDVLKFGVVEIGDFVKHQELTRATREHDDRGKGMLVSQIFKVSCCRCSKFFVSCTPRNGKTNTTKSKRTSHSWGKHCGPRQILPQGQAAGTNLKGPIERAVSQAISSRSR